MSGRKISKRTYQGHASFYVDGEKMPSPSKIKLEAPYLDRYHAQTAVDAIDEIFPECEGMTGPERRKAWLPAVMDAYGAAARRGTECHQVMEALVRGEPVRSADRTVVADAEAAARLLDVFKVQPLAAEQPLLHSFWWYSGTCDVIAESPIFDGPCILDYKFGRAVYPDFALQQSAYAHATDRIVEREQVGPRGGKMKPEIGYEPLPWHVNRETAYILHTTGGHSRLLEVPVGGETWGTVQAWVEAYWAFHGTKGDEFREVPEPDSDPTVGKGDGS